MSQNLTELHDVAHGRTVRELMDERDDIIHHIRDVAHHFLSRVVRHSRSVLDSLRAPELMSVRCAVSHDPCEDQETRVIEPLVKILSRELHGVPFWLVCMPVLYRGSGVLSTLHVDLVRVRQ